ncbi:MAG TPA: HU family DNA-binding protein [Candidatus Akkermansia intestinigallinarum]|uniref:HU family DNA-binding protein n=1 Tax=Candidatus Akkermansia intestinigallinarum TaxID=2838431 RepID=A0A9D2AH26_9BACT|nr:HU family DNA-binding protein [Candidatus Akkermansia intestinigallinarum]
MSNRSRQLLEAVRSRLGGTATTGAAVLALQAVLRALTDGLRQDGEVHLSGFGSFRIKTRAARRLLLPGRADEVRLPQRRVLCFSPSSRRQRRSPRGDEN